jgi:predicted nucleic acid-binding protein
MIYAAIDTNILVYAAQRGGDRAKHATATGLLRSLSLARRGMLPLQALSEFYAVASRKAVVSLEEAAGFMTVLAEMFPVREAVLADFLDATRIHHAHGVAFWDGMLWSVARRSGARYILSEDFQDGRDLEGVLFVNPFAPGNAALLSQITAGTPTTP